MCCSIFNNGEPELSVGDWVWDCQWLTDDSTCLCDKHTTTHVPHLSSHHTADRNQPIAANTGDWCQLTTRNTGDRNQLIVDSARDRSGDIGHRYHLGAALGHNSVIQCCWWTRSVLQHVHCSELCILYLFLLYTTRHDTIRDRDCTQKLTGPASLV